MDVEVASRELRNDTAGLLRRVEAGETIVITRRGKPVADLVPHITVRESRGLTPEDVMKIRAITAGDPTFAADIERISGGPMGELGPIP
ncbi:MAG TPA: type II toxin-antitoxin system prevent-host-death family antitoxin [Solirubrobacterales bacterium]|nr:type II toxin-antitoxin system prevent-host-death family antitoxin [Solirubrobacterales bacterium]